MILKVGHTPSAPSCSMSLFGRRPRFRMLGATQGGGEFSAVPSIRQIEVDGVKGRAKGLETIDSWEVYIKATVLEATPDSIKAALSAATVDSESDEDYDVITGNAEIELDDYIDNITWIGTLSGSKKPVIIQVYNALNTDGLKLTVKDKRKYSFWRRGFLKL